MFSLVLPFHSDFERLPASIQLIEAQAKRHQIHEILLCHNGKALTAEQEAKVRSFMTPLCKYFHTDDRGIGAGYKLGIRHSTQKWCVLSASDLPFGFTDIESLKKLESKPKLAIGSKAHPDSKIEAYTWKRKLASVGFWLFRAVFLGFQTPKDSQGTILIDTELARHLITKSQVDNYFFSVELITLAQKQGERALELPVVLENHDGESSVSLWKDSWRLARDVVRFAKRLRHEI